MNLEVLIDPAELNVEVANGYIRMSRHPSLPLRVYCYTEKTVYENRWANANRWSRGLVVDDDEEIVAWCMPKFFNASEHIDRRAYTCALPDEPFQVFVKEDGSLGTVFNFDGKWIVSTKGGFGSDQAHWAQEWLAAHDLTELPANNTYVTEIIYPGNRIVVDNRDTKTLALLTIFGSNGREKPLAGYGQTWELLGGTLVKEYPPAKLSRILFYAQRNQRFDGTPVTGTEAEGYVIRYRSGLRVKVKFSDYIRLHGIVTGLTERHVWELLREGRSLDALFEVLPDEYHDWLDEVAASLTVHFRAKAAGILRDLVESEIPWDPREFQKFAQDRPTAGALFSLYDLLSQHSWDAVKPAATSPWKDRE